MLGLTTVGGNIFIQMLLSDGYVTLRVQNYVDTHLQIVDRHIYIFIILFIWYFQIHVFNFSLL